jgi:hypothetical protein
MFVGDAKIRQFEKLGIYVVSVDAFLLSEGGKRGGAAGAMRRSK